MNAVLEGRKLRADYVPIAGDEFEQRIQDAALGSAMLRNAILRAKGHPVPTERAMRREALAPVVITYPFERKCCPTCGAPEKHRLSIQNIQAVVANFYGLPTTAMTTAQRGRSMAHPRQVAMYLASELTEKSLPDIGRRFGGRDHTTILYGIREVQKRIENDVEVAADVEALRKRLEA